MGSYDAAVSHTFVILDSPRPCTRCGRETWTFFAGPVCSRCAGVWTLAERAATSAAIRRPFPLNPKPRFSPPQKVDRQREVEMLIEALGEGHQDKSRKP
jgi:hypothetical protein